MPLTLRRRPRLPSIDGATPAASASPTGDGTSIPGAAPVEPARAAATETARTTRRVRHRRSNDWRDRMLGEVFFFLLGLGTWLSNAVFTILGVTAPIGLNPLTVLLGFAFHVLLSRAELHLWYRWRDPWYLLLLVGCVLIDVGTTLVGLRPIAAKWLPVLVGSTPENVRDWGQILIALVTNTAIPAWWPNALTLLLIAFAFALGSERLLRKFYVVFGSASTPPLGAGGEVRFSVAQCDIQFLSWYTTNT